MQISINLMRIKNQTSGVKKSVNQGDTFERFSLDDPYAIFRLREISSKAEEQSHVPPQETQFSEQLQKVYLFYRKQLLMKYIFKQT